MDSTRAIYEFIPSSAIDDLVFGGHSSMSCVSSSLKSEIVDSLSSSPASFDPLFWPLADEEDRRFWLAFGPSVDGQYFLSDSSVAYLLM